jgi:hypothetical protein
LAAILVPSIATTPVFTGPAFAHSVSTEPNSSPRAASWRTIKRATKQRSSRAIECRCRQDVAYRVIAANRIPDHATIARSRTHSMKLWGMAEIVFATPDGAGI